MTNRQKKVIKFQLKLPNNLPEFAEFPHKLSLELHPDDFKLSWLQFFNNKNSQLWKKLQLAKDKFTITDRRNAPQKRYWNLTSKIGDYIDSFHFTLQMYKADIIIRKRNSGASASVPNGSQQQSSSRVSTSSPNVKKVSRTNNISAKSAAAKTFVSSNPTSKHFRSESGHQPIVKKPRVEERVTAGPSDTKQNPGIAAAFEKMQNSRTVLMHLDPDDGASMADSMFSQDSQIDDLVKLGVELEDIKGSVCDRMLKHVDNTMMLSLKHELQQLINSGKYLRSTRHLPKNAMMLTMIFNLRA